MWTEHLVQNRLQEIVVRVGLGASKIGAPESITGEIVLVGKPPPKCNDDAMKPLPEDAIAMLAKPNPSVIATVRPDGQPVSVATWYLREDDGRILVNMDASRKRLDHIRADPHISLTVIDEANWYTHLSMQGRVVELRPDEGLVDIDRLSRHYGGNPYPVRDRDRFSAWIEVDRWHGWGALGKST